MGKAAALCCHLCNYRRIKNVEIQIRTRGVRAAYCSGSDESINVSDCLFVQLRGFPLSESPLPVRSTSVGFSEREKAQLLAGGQ
jgi:hypothetical protein